MCRYVAYLGEPLVLSTILYEPSNSLIHQASDAMESRTRINADGFGIGWYNPAVSPEPAVFKDLTPAWNNANLRSLARAVASSCILAHVRAAGRFDPVNRANCHPFQSDRLLWMHNGDIPCRARLHRRVVSIVDDELVARIQGNTDSELAFTLFLHLLGEARLRHCSAEELAGAMRQLIGQLVDWWHEHGDRAPLALNFCVANGHSIVASRYGMGLAEVPSLHVCRGTRFVCEDGTARVLGDEADRCVVLASEALADEGDWETLANGTLVLVKHPGHVELERLPLPR